MGGEMVEGFRQQAERVRRMAEVIPDATLRGQLLTVAADYELMAEAAERILANRLGALPDGP